jgi:hypothetical protein
LDGYQTATPEAKAQLDKYAAESGFANFEDFAAKRLVY